MIQPNLIHIPSNASTPAENNHLKRSGYRPYTFRFTVDQGPKFVGKRISISLETKDIAKAEWVSAICLASLKKAGFVLSDIKLGRPEQDFSNMALHDNIKAVIFNIRGEDDEMADTLQAAIDAAK